MYPSLLSQLITAVKAIVKSCFCCIARGRKGRGEED
jgi:hypothetical protein